MITLTLFIKIFWNNFIEYSKNNKWNIHETSKIENSLKSITYDHYSRNINQNKSNIFKLLFLCVYITHRNNNSNTQNFLESGEKGKLNHSHSLRFLKGVIRNFF
jgi:hypothetical protein